MNIGKNSINLAEDTYAYVGCVSEEQILETFKNNLKKYIDTIDTMDELTGQGLNKLSDQQYYDLFCKIYNMSLAEEDYLKIISKRNNQKYNRFTEIETFMTFSNLVVKGRDSWEQLY